MFLKLDRLSVIKQQKQQNWLQIFNCVFNVGLNEEDIRSMHSGARAAISPFLLNSHIKSINGFQMDDENKDMGQRKKI